MRRFSIAAAVLLFTAGLSNAGLYVPGEPCEFVPSNGKVNAQSFDRFRSRRSDLASIQVGGPEPSDANGKYKALAEELNRRRQRLTTDELVTLGAYYYRLGKTEEALTTWLEASRRDRSNFAALSNLVLLKLATRELRVARVLVDDVRRIQPRQLPGMTAEQSAWYAKVEDMLRLLIRRRAAEEPMKTPPESMLPDDLFEVQFVGDDGGYQPGQIAAAQNEKLPDDAIAVVQQLLYWLPHDPRLLWLLAELYNANGDPGSALTLLNECVNAMRFHPKLLPERQRALQRHVDDQRAREEQQRQ